MTCIICEKEIEINSVAFKIIGAKILGEDDFIEYTNIQEEGIVHADCFKRMINRDNIEDNTSVERTNILEFLDKEI